MVNVNAKASAIVYSERFPRDQHPMHKIITDALQRPRETGSVASRTKTSIWERISSGTGRGAVIRLLKSTTDHDEISEICGYTCQHAWHFLHAHSTHPYLLTLVEALMLCEHSRRFDYCIFMLNISEENSSFLCNILWTVE